MRTSLRAIACAAMSLVCLPWHGHAQEAASLSGTWTIDRDASEFPREVGFNADFLPAPGRGDSAPSGRRGRGGSGGGGGGTAPQPALRPQGESYDAAQRREKLTDEVRTPANRLTVVDQPDAVTITDERGNSRTFHLDTPSETVMVSDVPVLVTAHRESSVLIVTYSVADLRQLRYSFSRMDNRLVVDAQFVERGRGDSVRRIYNEGNGRPPSTSTTGAGAASSGQTPGGVPAAPGAPPAAMPRGGSEFTGLVKLGVVIEDLGAQAQGCGLTVPALEAAVSKPFTDAGIKVSRNSDEDTYVHVSIMTSTMPTGMCISRYDWSIYSTTDATLSYQQRPLLAQVLLAHKGGLSGSMPSTHAADVLRSLGDGLTQIAGIIHDANR